MNKISITIISNAMSHHQILFCEYMAKQEDIDFYFIATKPIAQERLQMGYENLNHSGNYIVRSYENKVEYKRARELAENSDFVIYGSAPYVFVRSRIWKNKWTFVYSERIFKNGIKDKKLFKKIIIYLLYYGMVPHRRLRLLCASAYAAKDFRKFGFKSSHMYKWGYFPPDTKQSLRELLESKEKNNLIWVARMIPWKHPELPVFLAERLKENQIPFQLTLVGDGPLFKQIAEMIKEKELSEHVTLTGSLPKDEVRNRMERSEILLATSDYGEGWGAVINEGMNSACAVVASHAMGATRFLIENEKNGLIFESENIEELYEKIVELLKNREKRHQIQKKAFTTIENEWNGKNAAKKLIYLCRQLQDGNTEFHYPEGICSWSENNI